MPFKISCIALCLICVFSLKAQEMKYLGFVDLDRDKYSLIGQFDSLFLIYRSSHSKNYIEAVNPDFKNNTKTELNIPKGHFHFFRIINDRTSFSIVYCLQNKGKTEIRLKKLSLAATELYDTLVLNYPDHVHIADIETVLSENRKQMLIYDFQNDNTLSWATFDLENLKISNQKYLNEDELLLKLEDAIVSDAADVFFLITENSRYRRRNNNIVMKSFTAAGKNYENICLLPGIYLESLKFKYDEVNGRLSGAALYSEKGYGAKGILSFKAIVPDVFTFSQIPFADTLQTHLKGGKNKRNNGVENLRINELILRRDGGFIAISEQYVRYEYQMPANFRNDFPTNRQVEFYYDNILVSSFHPDGAVHWNTVLYKNQKSENDEGRYSSYFLMKNPRGLRIIFNDEINWTSAVYEYELMPDGNQQRRRIFPDEAIEEKDILPEFRKAIQISANKFIFVQQKNNKLHFGAISY
jgi:hypothetical protein